MDFFQKIRRKEDCIDAENVPNLVSFRKNGYVEDCVLANSYSFFID